MQTIQTIQPYNYTPCGWAKNCRQPEWSLGNGLGSYASGTVTGAPARRHHGLLVASLHPPVARTMVWAQLQEELALESGRRYSLYEAQRADGAPAEGRRFLTRFTWDGLPCWEYRARGVCLQKVLVMERERNTAALAYTVTTGSTPASLVLTPGLCWRAAGDAADAGALAFSAVTAHGAAAAFSPAAAPEQTVRFWCSRGECLVLPKPVLFSPVLLATEIETGDPRPETAAALFAVTVSLPANRTTRFSVFCSLEQPDDTADAFALAEAERRRQAALVAQSGLQDPAARRLAVAADAFLVRRASTGGQTVLAGLPWFTDWGRDTMISLDGLCLCTRRFAEARSVLATFARYEKDGLVPNLFPDTDCPPLYNTADASLWYICAVWQYWQTAGQADDLAFIGEQLWPCIQSILLHYRAGTGFSIHGDPSDGLLCAGGGLDQVTWMDVRVGDRVMTPRHGKPVEINALWYTSLCIAAALAGRLGQDEAARQYRQHARQARDSFSRVFVRPDGLGLYDCIGPDGPDASLRPNQLLAVSLWRCLPEGAPALLAPAQEKAVVDTAAEKLYIGPGIRTLPPEDARYHPHYCGALALRDEAYHQGTAWGWLLGEFLFAYARVHRAEPDCPAVLRRLLQPALDSMASGGINGIAELFDADLPHTARGCFSQAWSVGEVLAAMVRLHLEHGAEKRGWSDPQAWRDSSAMATAAQRRAPE